VKKRRKKEEEERQKELMRTNIEERIGGWKRSTIKQRERREERGKT
jgi:hypothetical protein